jgi:predicted RND superfamily exporter protein
VVVSTLTNVIGFGVLAFSQHLGIRSLGVILTVGVAFLLVTSTAPMTAALRLVLPPPPNDA